MTIWQTLPGLTPYPEAMKLMDSYVHDIISHNASEKIILLEHSNVYTSGTSASSNDLVSPNDIPVFETGRGGKFTYHGPGQRVIYPILNLNNRTKDLRKYIANLEKWIISTLYEFDIDAFIAPERIGIWVLDKGVEEKIGAIGVRVKKWITHHGIAINISTDLEKFKGIVPCGLNNFGVTSMQKLGKNIDLITFDTILKEKFLEFF